MTRHELTKKVVFDCYQGFEVLTTTYCETEKERNNTPDEEQILLLTKNVN
jgi:hypothetical protein